VVLLVHEPNFELSHQKLMASESVLEYLEFNIFLGTLQHCMEAYYTVLDLGAQCLPYKEVLQGSVESMQGRH